MHLARNLKFIFRLSALSLNGIIQKEMEDRKRDVAFIIYLCFARHRGMEGECDLKDYISPLILKRVIIPGLEEEEVVLFIY